MINTAASVLMSKIKDGFNRIPNISCIKCGELIEDITEAIACNGVCGQMFHPDCTSLERPLKQYLTQVKKNLFWVCETCAKRDSCGANFGINIMLERIYRLLIIETAEVKSFREEFKTFEEVFHGTHNRSPLDEINALGPKRIKSVDKTFAKTGTEDNPQLGNVRSKKNTKKDKAKKATTPLEKPAGKKPKKLKNKLTLGKLSEENLQVPEPPIMKIPRFDEKLKKQSDRKILKDIPELKTDEVANPVKTLNKPLLAAPKEEKMEVKKRVMVRRAQLQRAYSIVQQKEMMNEPLDGEKERRIRKAYTAFIEKHLPILKERNPDMRLSELKQLLQNDWMQSPENPSNQGQA